jgi:coenzyme F420-0:L-glutamate ligase / coenzyme F420-1:gamma-L-glutamate ligase
VQLYPLKSKLVLPGDSLTARFIDALSSARLTVRKGDIIAVASKVVSLSEGNIVSLRKVRPTALAKRLGRKFEMPSKFAQVVLDEAEAVYGGVSGVLLTLKNGNAAANSGVDRKNAPGDSVIPWPLDPHRSAETIRRAFNRKFRKRIGVVIVDSRVTPLRLGTTGLAIACSGFKPVSDSRGAKDLYGRRVQITLQSLADGIAGAAQLLMGEARESIPFVLVRGAPVQLGDKYSSDSMTLPVKDCLYMSQISPQSELDKQFRLQREAFPK